MVLPENPNSEIDKMKKKIIQDLAENKNYQLNDSYRYLVDIQDKGLYSVSASTKEPFFTVSKKLSEDATLALGYNDKYYLVPYRKISKDVEGVTVTDGNYRVRMKNKDNNLELDGEVFKPQKL